MLSLTSSILQHLSSPSSLFILRPHCTLTFTDISRIERTNNCKFGKKIYANDPPLSRLVSCTAEYSSAGTASYLLGGLTLPPGVR